ncbi:N-acetyltransferase [Caproiciproducens sp. NJN-50]|uniref:GNAT family N-acetyltransferase n=1 Tax=Acutalibacteraceae TaxID=3082771 RepID=UPI000FFE2958|nr:MULTISPECIES: N-acetyltransferase [Acutalibacteraceae]QAT50795.1 N-acetyltransferase [Caproiciproducens sp. NJN-50]
MKNNYRIRPETKADHRAAENLTREAFWNVYRPGCTEHYVLHRFRDREEFIPELDLVMEKDGEIIGHVMYVRSAIKADDGRTVPIMTFGPISIAPDCQRLGYGTILLRHSMDKAGKLGAGALAITGNIGFYGKSGFVVASTKGIHYSAEPRDGEVPYFLIKELKPGFLDGITGSYKEPEGYFVDDAEAEAFDAQFPPKEKLKLPGQLFQL